MEYFLHEKAKAATKEYLKKSFDKTAVLHDLEEHDGAINETPMTIINHLWDQIPDHEKQRAINKIEKVLDIKWDRDQPIQKYMKELQDAK